MSRRRRDSASSDSGTEFDASIIPRGSCVSIIIPTYNERANLPLLLWLLDEALGTDGGLKRGEQFEVIVVDDGSPDGTGDVCRELQKHFSYINLVSRSGKLGLGTAYKEGLKHVKGDLVILMDTDLSHHPKDIIRFLRKHYETKADIVTGTRYSPDGGGVAGWDIMRVLTSRVANFIAHVLLNVHVSDLTGSFRLYRTKELKSLINKVEGKGYVFQMEMMARSIRQQHLNVEEVPICFIDRLFGSSKLGTQEITQYLMGLFKLFWTL